ncbi:hypothetical protein ACIBBG_28050 [Micromonospora chersina]|uniref:hypothetical protein n=1 Tax=Micromonospora chersina TaxID=47854 RepID=UPI0037972FE6
MFNGSGDELGIRRCLCDDRESELLTDARNWRTEVAAAKSDVKVEASGWKMLDGDGNVSAAIAFRFTMVDQVTGRVTFIRGSEYQWRFRAKRERGIGGGWRICRVDAPPLCGSHLRC